MRAFDYDGKGTGIAEILGCMVKFSEIQRPFYSRSKQPKKFIEASIIAKKPNIFAVSNIFSAEPAKAAIMAPTTITDEIAFVTDIKGVCNEGVTLQTT